MARYRQAFKDRAVARLLPPESANIGVVAQEVGRLSEHASEKEFLSLDSAKVAVRVMPLLSGTLEVEALSVAGLKANLVRAKDGRMNTDDLAGKVQVGLFNILQEGDVQIKGFPVRLPLDVVTAPLSAAGVDGGYLAR